MGGSLRAVRTLASIKLPTVLLERSLSTVVEADAF